MGQYRRTTQGIMIDSCAKPKKCSQCGVKIPINMPYVVTKDGDKTNPSNPCPNCRICPRCVHEVVEEMLDRVDKEEYDKFLGDRFIHTI